MCIHLGLSNLNPSFFPWRSPHGSKIGHFREETATKTVIADIHVYIFCEKLSKFDLSAIATLILKISRKPLFDTHEAHGGSEFSGGQ